jgi:hypothetical protein
MADLSPLRRRMIEDMTVRNLSPGGAKCRASPSPTPGRSKLRSTA